MPRRPKKLTPEKTLVTLEDLAKYHARWVAPLHAKPKETEALQSPIATDALHVEQAPQVGGAIGSLIHDESGRPSWVFTREGWMKIPQETEG